jgi:hypothetical protein
MNFSHPILATLLLTLSATTHADKLPISPSPEGAKVYIISPANGETISQKVTVKFGLQGMGIAPAGFEKPKTGHHHLMIDNKKLPAFDKPMGSDVTHFGGGQTEKTIELSKGEHTLQLILGNHLHIPHNPPVVSKKITVFVK